MLVTKTVQAPARSGTANRRRPSRLKLFAALSTEARGLLLGAVTAFFRAEKQAGFVKQERASAEEAHRFGNTVGIFTPRGDFTGTGTKTGTSCPCEIRLSAMVTDALVGFALLPILPVDFLPSRFV